MSETTMRVPRIPRTRQPSRRNSIHFSSRGPPSKPKLLATLRLATRPLYTLYTSKSVRLKDRTRRADPQLAAEVRNSEARAAPYQNR